jgi:hypothetical protein
LQVDALAIAARLGVCFGVVVDKSFLMDQWRERIAQYLPHITVGYARSDHVDVHCTAVIVMAKSLSLYAERGDYVFPRVGLWIFDEAHKFCAETLSRCLPAVASRYILALSATPQRRDGLDLILTAWFGVAAYSAQRENEAAEVYRIVYDNPAAQKVRILHGSGKPNIARMVNEICADEERNTVLAWHLAKALLADRRILVLSDRREHLRILEEAVRHQLRLLSPTSTAQGDWMLPELAALAQQEEQFAIDYYVGGRKPHELAQAERADLILATFQMAKEALDLKPPPDALVLASPKADTVQAIGRMRIELLDKLGRIYDIVDPWSVFQGLTRKRDALYTQRRYQIIDWRGIAEIGPRAPPEPEEEVEFPVD